MSALRSRPLIITARVLLAPYLIAVLLITWLPANAAGKVTGIVGRIARSIAARFDVSFLTAYNALEFLANIALFMPLGILVALAWPKLRWWHIVLCGLALTLLIEGVQMTLPSRFPTASDIVANTAGAGAGAVLVALVHAMVRPRRPTLVS